MKKENNLQSSLAKAKGLGAAGSGTSVWWAQRVSAVALVPLVIWFSFFMLQTIEYQDIDLFTSMFTSPFVTLLLALFIAVGLYHGNLGMKEIIEDYVHGHYMKFGLILLVKFFSLVTAIAGVCAALVLHLSTFSVN
jgi:succinate dehydrogenase / fumarate reductase membrane anchor subunit